METNLREAMTAGVVVEFRDSQGHTVGQAVYTDWRGRPVPNLGDTLCCDDTRRSVARRRARLLGRVRSRQFDFQIDEQGEPSVWVLLVVETIDRSAAAAAEASAQKNPRVTFSLN